MANFAQIGGGDIVVNIIVAEPDVIESGALGNPAQFIEYGAPGASAGLSRARIGDTYYANYPAFISPKPYPSWHLNTDTFEWDAPYPNPNADCQEKCPDGSTKQYVWDEETVSWVAQPCEGEG